MARVSPAIASAPHPRPMKKRSTLWYSDDAVIAMMPGMAYLRISWLMGLTPSSVGMAPAIGYGAGTNSTSKRRAE